MKVSIKKLSEVIQHGNYILPYINYLSEQKNENDINSFLKVMKLLWTNQFDEALKEIERSLMMYDNSSIRNLFLSIKLNILTNEGKKDEAEKIYIELYDNFSKMPVYLRGYVATIMKLSFSIFNFESLKEIRTWSDSYKESAIDYSYFLYSSARKKVNENNFDEAVKLFLKGASHAEDFFHPSALILGYNNAAWFMKEISPYEAVKIAEKLSYYIGYYYEDISNNFVVLDTIYEVEKKAESLSFFMTVSVMNDSIQNLSGTNELFSRNFFDYKIKEIKKYVVNYNHNSYSNGKILGSYIKKVYEQDCSNFDISSKSIKKIISGETKTIKADTIKQIIKCRNIKISKNLPYAVLNEVMKLKINESFIYAVEKLKSLSVEERKIKFLSAYSSLINKKLPYPLKKIYKLLDMELDRFIKIASNDYNMMKILIFMFEKVHQLFVGRMFLFEKLLTELSENNRLELFVKNYISISEDSRNVFEKFLRNYVRFSIDFFDSSYLLNLEHEKFCEKFLLKHHSFIMSYYSLIEKEKIIFDELIKII